MFRYALRARRPRQKGGRRKENAIERVSFDDNDVEKSTAIVKLVLTEDGTQTIFQCRFDYAQLQLK